MNSSANIKHFQMIKLINEKDEEIISKITIVLRRDKIEAPYYMIVKIRLSACIDRGENGLIHAMDMLNFNRMYNLSEEKYDEIKSLIGENSYESNLVQISKSDKQLKIALMSKNNNEFTNLFREYQELFDEIDNLID